MYNEQQKQILELEERLKTALRSQDIKEMEHCESRNKKGRGKQRCGAGNKENSPDRDEALQRPETYVHQKVYTHDLGRPLNYTVMRPEHQSYYFPPL
jgi:hypothetical protein